MTLKCTLSSLSLILKRVYFYVDLPLIYVFPYLFFFFLHRAFVYHFIRMTTTCTCYNTAFYLFLLLYLEVLSQILIYRVANIHYVIALLLSLTFIAFNQPFPFV